MTTWLPWIGISISMATLLFTIMKFGREVHLDDKREVLNELSRCKDRCEEISKNLDKIMKAHDALMEDYRRLKEHNYELMARITKLRNGDKSS